MTRYFVVSKYFGYDVGGAEKSTLQYLLHQNSSDPVHGYFFNGIKSFSSAHLKVHFPCKWKFKEEALVYLPASFRYLEFLLNLIKLKKLARNIDSSNVLLTYGLYSPAFLYFYKGRKILMIRDETNLGIDQNYHTGLKRIFKSLHTSLNLPFRFAWLKLLKIGLRRDTRIICNSHFMRSLCSKTLDVSESNIEVVYPQLDLNNLKEISLKPNRMKVVHVGRNKYKGFSIFLELSKRFPDIDFVNFDRENEDVRVNNIEYHSWTTTMKVLEEAKVVLIPSIWNEAFCRLAAEAAYLKIPVVASNKGGLPEALRMYSHNKNNYIIVDEINDIEAWSKALEKFL